MRILHTSDWHLGQKFINQSREAEQQMALDWLLGVISAEKIDTLIVSGDIFDVNNPPVAAEEMYYRFLTQLKTTGCQHVVITGGNHDSASKLNAPRGLLRALDMYVVGAATDPPENEIIYLKNDAGKSIAAIVAVPFLRERDFRTTSTGETVAERIQRIQAGIIEHYTYLADQLTGFKGPVIAMGHLFAKGASTHAEQENIYLGNLDNIAAEQFPERFDYIALGHIHRMQIVGKQQRIRYCGSLIPLSFSEIKDKKGVLIAEFSAKGALESVKEVISPVFRRLITIKGKMPEVEKKLLKAHQPDDPLPAWVEVVVTGDPGVARPDHHLRLLAENWHLDILKIRVERTGVSWADSLPATDLASLSTDEVFLQKCQSKGLDEATISTLQETFGELKSWVLENEEKL